MAKASHFWQLPRELRDEIYSFAYTKAGKVDGVKTRYDTYNLFTFKIHLESGRPNKMRHSVPWSICSPLVVSKQYLVDALPVVLRRTIFSFLELQDLEAAVKKSASIHQHIRSVTLKIRRFSEFSPTFANVVNSCPRLTDVRIASEWPVIPVDHHVLDSRIMLLAYGEDRLDTLKREALGNLRRMRGLRRLVLTARCLRQKAASWEIITPSKVYQTAVNDLAQHLVGGRKG